jgi:hypothetical protein
MQANAERDKPIVGDDSGIPKERLMLQLQVQ